MPTWTGLNLCISCMKNVVQNKDEKKAMERQSAERSVLFIKSAASCPRIRRQHKREQGRELTSIRLQHCLTLLGIRGLSVYISHAQNPSTESPLHTNKRTTQGLR